MPTITLSFASASANASITKTITAGGSVVVPVCCNGSAWTVF